jgi:hypothetical protein
MGYLGFLLSISQWGKSQLYVAEEWVLLTKLHIWNVFRMSIFIIMQNAHKTSFNMVLGFKGNLETS